MKTIRISLLVTVITAPMALFGQLITFSQFDKAGEYLTPTAVGEHNYVSLRLNDRVQWSSLNQSVRFTQASFIYPLNNSHRLNTHLGGIGLQVENSQDENAGVRQFGVYLNMAYDVKLSYFKKSHLIFGLKGGYRQSSIDVSKIETGMAYNPAIGFDPNISQDLGGLEDRYSSPDFGAGLTYYFNPELDYRKVKRSFYIGASMMNLFHKDYVVNGEALQTKTKYNFFGMSHFLPFKHWEVGFGGLFTSYDHLQAFQVKSELSYLLIPLNSKMFVPNKLTVAGSYKENGTIVPEAHLSNEYFDLGFSYDIHGYDETKSLRSYELSLFIHFKDKSAGETRTPRYQHLMD